MKPKIAPTTVVDRNPVEAEPIGEAEVVCLRLIIGTGVLEPEARRSSLGHPAWFR
jgi:hypothetical protein